MKFIKYSILLLLFLNVAHAKELKVGVMQHDFNSKLNHRYEKGQNIIFEYLFDKIEQYNHERFELFPHIGASLNNTGYTSNIYTGITVKLDITKSFLSEVSLGISINNAERKTSKKRRALGSNLLFRESFSIGYKISEIHSVSLIIDHISTADMTKPNPGLTDLGIRYGYKF